MTDKFVKIINIIIIFVDEFIYVFMYLFIYYYDYFNFQFSAWTMEVSVHKFLLFIVVVWIFEFFKELLVMILLFSNISESDNCRFWLCGIFLKIK
jgi:hypothetical protein